MNSSISWLRLRCDDMLYKNQKSTPKTLYYLTSLTFDTELKPAQCTGDTYGKSHTCSGIHNCAGIIFWIFYGDLHRWRHLHILTESRRKPFRYAATCVVGLSVGLCVLCQGKCKICRKEWYWNGCEMQESEINVGDTGWEIAAEQKVSPETWIFKEYVKPHKR